MPFSNQELKIFESLGVSLSEDYHVDLIYLEEADFSTKDIILNYKCAIIKSHIKMNQKMIFGRNYVP